MKGSIPYFLCIAGILLNSGCSPKRGSLRDDRLFLVQEGVPPAMVVTADEPTPIAAMAARELALHLEKATGAKIKIVPESHGDAASGPSRIYVGNTTAAAQQGLMEPSLPKDSFRLTVVGTDLYICAAEEHQEINLAAYKGTLFGVYDVLDRFVGVRWLWPGKLGTYVPRKEAVVLPARLDETIAPAFQFRRFRTSHIQKALSDYPKRVERLGFSKPVLRDYAADLDLYLLRHHTGETVKKPHVGHYFARWWLRYGKDHPDWFKMRKDGGRGPLPSASEREKMHVVMNVANPQLHRYILETAWDGGDTLRLGEADWQDFCMSPESRAWDVAPKGEIPEFARVLYDPPVSDRYARFWQTIQDEAVKRNPKVLITTFLYFNYLPAPVESYRLDHVYGEYVPWGTSAVAYYPMSDEAHSWNKKQWKGWVDTGMKMGYRPNYFLGGYVMPHLSTWQAADMFKFAAAEGMVLFDFDSLKGDWATKGPMYYIHMRLVKNPDADVADLRREYFDAFGPAGYEVEKYFDYWEEYSATKARLGGVKYNNPFNARRLYPPEAFDAADALLKEAREKASTSSDPQFSDRVEFLQVGLDHARLSSDFIGTLRFSRERPYEALPVSDPQELKAAQEALKRLIGFRRKHEKTYFADLIYASTMENRRIDTDVLLGINAKDDPRVEDHEAEE